MIQKIIESRAPLIGGDISHWNYPFSSYFGDFMIHKATEGSAYLDPRWDVWVENRRYYGNLLGDQVLNGSYHFMSVRSEVIPQAENYCEAVLSSDIDQILILDLEAEALDRAIADPEFGLKWLRKVESAMGVKPFIYTNLYGMKNLNAKYSEYPLWLATRGRSEVTTTNGFMGKPVWMWQFTEIPFDLNIFNGTANAWRQMSWKH